MNSDDRGGTCLGFYRLTQPRREPAHRNPAPTLAKRTFLTSLSPPPHTLSQEWCGDVHSARVR